MFFASNFEARNKRKHLRKKRAVATSSKFLVMALQLSPSVIYYLLFNPSFSRKKVLLFHSGRSLFCYHSFSQKKNNGNEILHFWCKSAFQHMDFEPKVLTSSSRRSKVLRDVKRETNSNCSDSVGFDDQTQFRHWVEMWLAAFQASLTILLKFLKFSGFTYNLALIFKIRRLHLQSW